MRDGIATNMDIRHISKILKMKNDGIEKLIDESEKQILEVLLPFIYLKLNVRFLFSVFWRSRINILTWNKESPSERGRIRHILNALLAPLIVYRRKMLLGQEQDIVQNILKSEECDYDFICDLLLLLFKNMAPKTALATLAGFNVELDKNIDNPGQAILYFRSLGKVFSLLDNEDDLMVVLSDLRPTLVKV